MGTIADKLANIEATKSALKAAINGSGSTVGDKFADYPRAVDDFRSKIATAITAKGVSTNATDMPDQMAANIGAIETGIPYKRVEGYPEPFDICEVWVTEGSLAGTLLVVLPFQQRQSSVISRIDNNITVVAKDDGSNFVSITVADVSSGSSNFYVDETGYLYAGSIKSDKVTMIELRRYKRID